MEDFDDLPIVTLSSPGRCSNMSFFEMPDASVIAAQRQLEYEQDKITAQIMKKTLLGFNDDFEMPSPEQLARDRLLESEGKTALANILQSINQDETLSPIKEQLTSDVESSFSNSVEIKVLSENPGINFDSVNFNDSDLSESSVAYLNNKYKSLLKPKNMDDLEYNLNSFLRKMETSTRLLITDNCDIIYSRIVLICTILLDKRLRMVMTEIDILEILWLMMDQIPIHLKSSLLLSTLSHKIVNTFKHFHDRFYIAECLLKLKCNPSDLETNPRYFTMRLSKYVLYCTLFDILEYEYSEEAVQHNSFKTLKCLITNCGKSNSLEPYEQYILMKILLMLNDAIHISEGNKRRELEAKNCIYTFFNNIIGNHQHGWMVADICKVKLMFARFKFLWREEREDDPNS